MSAGHLADVEVEKTYKLTTFDSVKTTQGDLIELTFDGIVDLIKNGPLKRTKGALPLLQGVERPGNSRKAGTAVGDVHVIIADYDAGQVSIDEAACLLQAEGVQAILATTASHMQKGKKGKDKGKSLGHRLRVLLPLKKPVPATEYADLAEAANAALGGVLAPESAEPSRIFHYGRVEGVPFEVRVVAEGIPLDSWALLGDRSPFVPTAEAAEGAKAAIDNAKGTSANPVPEDRGLERANMLIEANAKTIHDLKFALVVVPHGSYPEWTNTGVELSSLKGTEFEGEVHALWLDWTCKGPNYRPGDEDKWATYTANKSTFRSVFWKASKADSTWETRAAESWARMQQQLAVQADGLTALKRNDKGRALATRGNLYSALRNPQFAPARVVADNFLGERLVTDRKTGLLRCFTDDDYFHIGRLLEDGPATFASIPTELLRSAVSAVASEDVIDTAQEWVGRLQWDRVERINKFFVDYFSAEDTPYVQAVGAYTWTALAGRIVEPGCQADMAPVLQGIQGVRKTSAVRALAPDPEMFVELDLTEDDTELARLMRGKLVGEIAELRGLRGRDSGAIKAWVSRRTEQWTPKYKEFSTSYQRRLILFGTTNEEQFLDDPTGNRRWLPMKVGSVDVDAIERDRDQLWAEGLVRFRIDGVEWKAAEDLAKLEHAEFTITDPWAETAADWLDGRATYEGGSRARPKDRVTVNQLLKDGLLLSSAQINKSSEMRGARVLKQLGWTKSQSRVGGRTIWWVRP